MGCHHSKPDESASKGKPDAVSNAEQPKEAYAQEEEERPRPKIFAIMRNGHEVVRGSQLDLEDALAKNDLKGAKEIYGKLRKWSRIHMKMEEGNGDGKSPTGMFKLLDSKFENVATDSGLHEEHVKLEEKEKALDKAFASSDLASVKKAFDEFKTVNLAHLEKEEGIMMPKVMEMQKSGVNLKQAMQQEILALVVDSPDFEFFVRYANDVLERHPGGMPRVRVFDHALWAVSADNQQWRLWDKWIKETVSEKTYKELYVAINS